MQLAQSFIRRERRIEMPMLVCVDEKMRRSNEMAETKRCLLGWPGPRLSCFRELPGGAICNTDSGKDCRLEKLTGSRCQHEAWIPNAL